MSQQLTGTILIESALIVLTTFLLTQPEVVFRGVSARLRSATTFAGLITLCVTFCWSVIFGCILTIHQFSLRH